jgi:hypothetical protein
MNRLVKGMPDAEYHAHPALSTSGAKRLLPPSCPARFKWEQENGRPPKREFDVGSAAHLSVLGTGWPLVVIDAPDWRTKAAKEERDAAYAAGHIPILTKEKVTVDAMAAALREHPKAAELLDPEHGDAEVSGFWHDKLHGIDRRFRADFLRRDGDRVVIVDYKSALSAEPGKFARSAFNFGYDIQDQFYRDGARALDLADVIDFMFVVQEVNPPYLVTVCELSLEAQRVGRIKVDLACELFAECTANDAWPAYTSEVAVIEPPRWASYEYDEEMVI